VAITPEGFFDSSSDARRWYEALERTNAENVRASLDQTAGSRGTIRIRGASMTIGLARDWLAWHDQQKAVREARFRRWQFIASASVLLAAVGLALKAWLSPIVREPSTLAQPPSLSSVKLGRRLRKLCRNPRLVK
jgi:hypothetical protein